MAYAKMEPPRRCECRSYNTIPGSLTDTWDFYYRRWKCEDCERTWLVGDIKNPTRKPMPLFCEDTDKEKAKC